MSIVWTEELVSHLRRLYDDQFSYAEIAEKLKAMGYPATKNCCVGKGRRIGLPQRKEAQPSNSAMMERQRQQRLIDAQRKRERRRMQNGNGAEKFSRGTYVRKVTPETMGRKALRTGLLIDLDPDQCRWPVEEIGHATYLFCCEDAWPGRSYCPAHCEKSYGSNWASG